MKNRNLLYIPAVVLFGFAVAALAVHFSGFSRSFDNLSRDFDLPIRAEKAVVTEILAGGESTGLMVGDKLVLVNGLDVAAEGVWAREFAVGQRTGEIELTVQRGDQQVTTVVRMVPFERSFAFWAQFTIGIIYVCVIPLLCFAVAFWVVFVRVHDFLAWILLFLMLGFGTLGLEGHPELSFVGTFTRIIFSTWPIAMLLFGVYFPERLPLDARFPWIKYLLIVPLTIQAAIMIVSQFLVLGGKPTLYQSIPHLSIVGTIGFFMTLAGVSMFFALLGWKSGTLKNPDARRRLKLLVYGTSAAMLPSFAIIIYGLITGKQGSFFDRAHWGFALFALVMLCLFPITMGYVIIVRRAMDVGVVVRQGVQYALARNSVKILQFALLVGVIGAVFLIFRASDRFSTLSQIGFVAAGFAVIPLIDWLAKNLRVWIDRRFFRDAYDAEKILSELSDGVRTMVETQPLLETVTARISESMHVEKIALLLRDGSSFAPAHALGFSDVPAIRFDESGATVDRLRHHADVTIFKDDADSWVNTDLNHEERGKLSALDAQLLLPVGFKDKFAGFISLGPKRSEEPYSPNDLRLLRSVASQTGLALENSRLTEAIAREAAQKERLNRELEIAREVQERLFPQELPAVPGLDYYGACRPALGVGGDYYDFLELGDGKFGIAIGDVSGKGIGASLMMAGLQASLRGQALHCGDNLSELMTHVNTLLYEASTSNRYATFFYAQYDATSRRLIYVNAGHNPPFLLRADGSVERLEAGGAVVGMLPSMFVNYEQGEIQLESGDMIVGFTDGISEAMNPAEEEWGEEAMLAELRAVADESANAILAHVVAGADRFADGAKQHDDMTMIVVRAVSSEQ